MIWEVRLNKRAVKNYPKLPVNIQERFKALALELRALGPVQPPLAPLWQNPGA